MKAVNDLEQALTAYVSENRNALSTPDYDAMKALAEILRRGEFYFEAEPWLLVSPDPESGDHLRYEDAPQAHEMLLRVRFFAGQDEKRHAQIQQQAMHALTCFAATGHGPLLDRILIEAALAQAQERGQFPVSLNISAQSATCPEFWEALTPVLAPYRAKDIIFEILEHDCRSLTPDLGPIKALRAQGYRFALDDFENDKGSFMRLAFFGECLDFVKIDGKVIRSALAEGRELHKLLGHIRKYAPDAALVAEWIESAAEARHLRSVFNIGTVQGRDLAPDYKMPLSVNVTEPDPDKTS